MKEVARERNVKVDDLVGGDRPEPAYERFGRRETAPPALTTDIIVLTSSSSMQILGLKPARLKAASSRTRVGQAREVRASGLRQNSSSVIRDGRISV